jgi:hypothetical protein
MNYDVLHNFISPVTGRIIVGTKDYIIIGGNNGVGIPSPILIDLRLDFMNLRRDYNYARSASIVIGFPNTQLPNAQILSNLEDGILVTTKGILSTTTNIITELPNLTYKYIWRGNENNRPVESDDLTHIIEVDLPNIKFALDIINEFMFNIVPIVISIIDNADTIDLYLEGFVSGGPIKKGVITTSIKSDASMNDYRLTNLKPNPEADFDAVNFNFLWNLMHDEVEILWQ